MVCAVALGGLTEAARAEVTDEFGPVLVVEQIEVRGNTTTSADVIRRALPIQPGDALQASDARFRESRFKLLALGYFRDVSLEMNKGSARGQVILVVTVEERGTVVLNNLWFGRTSLTPYWLGLDVGERNLLGLGFGLAGGFIYAANNDEIEGSREQWAAELRVGDRTVLGSKWGASAALTLVRGSEPYRVSGGGEQPQPNELRAFPYRRFGGRAGLNYNASSLTRLGAQLRIEQIDATLPIAPTYVDEEGNPVAIDLHLDPGSSRVMTAGFTFDRDTRPDPILPHAGGHLAFAAEIGTVVFGGDYQYATIYGRYEHYWPLFKEKHAIAVKAAGGVVIGDAPRFERIHIADVDRMLTPRALGLVLSTAAPLAILGTRDDKPLYGDLGGIVNVEYAIQLFRGRGIQRVYGGDIFIGAGLWGLAESRDLQTRDTSLWDALPLDLYIDAGLRVDTDVGVFELTFANALGRLR